jgi:ribosomal protein L35AE/L33A
MTLQEARENIGRSVVYKPFEGCSKSQIEYGVITSVNDRYVFVRYGNELQSKATGAENLKLA